MSDNVRVESNETFENGDSGIRLRIGVDARARERQRVAPQPQPRPLDNDTSDSWIAGNEFYENARPGGVSTTGLLLDDGSHRNRIERNLSYLNQDSGFQVSGTAAVVTNQANVLVRNISYANGDHGFDMRESDGTRLISNTSYGNQNDGFSVEGNSANTMLAQQHRRRTTASSPAATTSGWTRRRRSASRPTTTCGRTRARHGPQDRVQRRRYDTVTAFRNATGHELHGSGIDPRFANAGAGDFHPGLGGSAIDAANAATTGFQALDFYGLPPVDIASASNAGAGMPNFADRGALELQRVDAPPTARISLSTRLARMGQQVTANASARATTSAS